MPSASKKDYYETLGVGRTADADEIRKAYRKLARKYHPDLNPGDKAAEERFKKVQEAYDILSDENKKKVYDQFGFLLGQHSAEWRASERWHRRAGRILKGSISRNFCGSSNRHNRGGGGGPMPGFEEDR